MEAFSPQQWGNFRIQIHSGDNPSSKSLMLTELLIWITNFLMEREREGDGICLVTPNGIEVAFVFLHKWTRWMRTNICNSYAFGDERRRVCQLWDDVSWINTLSLNVTEKYMPVTLEVSIVGIKCPRVISGSQFTGRVLQLIICS